MQMYPFKIRDALYCLLSRQWGDEIIDAKVKLNPRQKESLIAITSEAPRIPPILVIGPFGTGIFCIFINL